MELLAVCGIVLYYYDNPKWGLQVSPEEAPLNVRSFSEIGGTSPIMILVVPTPNRQ